MWNTHRSTPKKKKEEEEKKKRRHQRLAGAHSAGRSQNQIQRVTRQCDRQPTDVPRHALLLPPRTVIYECGQSFQRILSAFLRLPRLPRDTYSGWDARCSTLQVLWGSKDLLLLFCVCWQGYWSLVPIGRTVLWTAFLKQLIHRHRARICKSGRCSLVLVVVGAFCGK